MSAVTPPGANPNLGWKIHLNFDVDDPDVTARVQRCAHDLKTHGLLIEFKIGNGGGKAAGDNRKEATLYAGPMANALVVAAHLESELGEILQPPDRATMRDDVPLTETGKTWARFTAPYGLSGSYHQYGSRGICHLNNDMQPTAWGGRVDPVQARRNALDALRADFKEYFTGPRNELRAILECSDRVERDGPRTVFGWDPAEDVTREVALSEREAQWWRDLPGATWAGAPHLDPAAADPWWIAPAARDDGLGLA